MSAAAANPAPAPTLSAATAHIKTHTPDTTDIPSPQTPHHHALALHVQHSLQHQHHWTALRIHTRSPLAPYAPLPRPLVSGLPPRRLYIHPDEQIEILKEDARRKKMGETVDQVLPEREWVLPAHLREKWSLRRMADVFDGVGLVPPAEGQDEGEGATEKKWRQTKRVVLGILEDDGTVVYYLVHDGLVKPRQN